jgi:ribonuclease P protein component
VRNRLKRWVREYLRRHLAEVPDGDQVLVAKTTAATAAHAAIERDLARIFARLKERR